MSRHHESRVDGKHVAVYGAVMLVVLLVGGMAIWSFFTRQSAAVVDLPLPRVTMVTADASSPPAASWVALLTRAQLQPTLVPLDQFEPVDGIVIFCGVPVIPANVAARLTTFLRRGGGVIFVGTPPVASPGMLQLSVDQGVSDSAMRLSEATSPLLARLNPGYDVQVRRAEVSFLRESPRMIIDARWRENARAAVMHVEENGVRYLWLGLDPQAVVDGNDSQLLLLLRTACRWAAGQPISDGAVGADAIHLGAGSRRSARAARFAFSVDRLASPRLFSVRMLNRGGQPLTSPTVKVWLPRGARRAKLERGLFSDRDVQVADVPEERACVVTLPRLAANEVRTVRLKSVD